MFLDPRIKDYTKVFSSLKSEEAREFIGNYGYFAKTLGQFRKIADDAVYAKLINVNQDFEFTGLAEDGIDGYAFFIPEQFVEPLKVEMPEEPSEVSVEELPEKLRDLEEFSEKVSQTCEANCKQIAELRYTINDLKAFKETVNEKLEQIFEVISRLENC